MTSPEKYTLPRVRDIVLLHGERLGITGDALGATEGNDPEILAMLSERALKAADALFEIDNVRGVQGHDDLPEFEDEDLWRAIDGLPPLVMSADAACADPTAMCSVSERWMWCHAEANRISSGLIAWVEAHEKDVGKPKEALSVAEKKPAEIIRLPVGIPGIGRAGDQIVHDPDHPDPRFRLSNVHPLDLDRLEEIRETVREWADAAKQKEVGQ